MKILIALILSACPALAGAQVIATCTNHVFPETCFWDYELRNWACEKIYPEHDRLPYAGIDTLTVIKYADGSVAAINLHEPSDGSSSKTTTLASLLPTALCTGSVHCETPDRSQGFYIVEYNVGSSYYTLEKRSGTIRSEVATYQSCK